MFRKFKQGLAGLLLGFSLMLPNNGNAQNLESVTFNSTTNNASIVWDASCWATQYVINANSSEHGTIELDGVDSDNYADSGKEITLNAIPDEHYKFSGWQGLPYGSDTNANPVSFPVNEAYEISANFVLRQQIIEDVGFSSVKPKINSLELTIPNTYTDSMYSVWYSTNLLDSVWNFRDEKAGNGTNLIFNFDLEDIIGFFRGKRTYEEP
jgi:hypothetical protein